MNIIKKAKKILRKAIIALLGSDFINSLSNDRWHVDFLKHGLTREQNEVLLNTKDTYVVYLAMKYISDIINDISRREK